MTVTIPTSEAQYGYVVGRVIRALGDSADPDDKPDAVAAVGKVTFTPKATLGRTTDYSAFIVREKLDAPLDPQGNLVRYEGATPAGIALTVGAYKVEFALASGSIPSFDIEVTAGHTQASPLDLVTAAPYVPPSGVTVQTMLVPADAVVGQVLAWSASGLEWVDMAGGGGGGAVSSVAGRTGAVVLSSADLTDAASLATDAELTAGLAGKANTADLGGAALLDVGTTAGTVAAGSHNHTGVYAPALGADDNYVTDAEKVKLANLSGTNTGDQDLSGYLTTSAAPELIRDTMGTALVAGANVTITPNDAGDSITIAASGGGGGGGATVPVFGGKLIGGWAISGSRKTLAVTAGQMIAVPLWIESARTISSVEVNVSVASTAGSVRLGIYSMGSDPYAATLLADFGTVTTASAGNKLITGLSQPAPAGCYWLVAHADEAFTFGASLSGAFVIGDWFAREVSVNPLRFRLVGDVAFGPLPPTIPALGIDFSVGRDNPVASILPIFLGASA